MAARRRGAEALVSIRYCGIEGGQRHLSGTPTPPEVNAAAWIRGRTALWVAGGQIWRREDLWRSGEGDGVRRRMARVRGGAAARRGRRWWSEVARREEGGWGRSGAARKEEGGRRWSGSGEGMGVVRGRGEVGVGRRCRVGAAESGRRGEGPYPRPGGRPGGGAALQGRGHRGWLSRGRSHGRGWDGAASRDGAVGGPARKVEVRGLVRLRSGWVWLRGGWVEWEEVE
nr:protein argonaute 3-like [Aegilops tauschii subsp. strangulata]